MRRGGAARYRWAPPIADHVAEGAQYVNVGEIWPRAQRVIPGVEGAEGVSLPSQLG